MRRMRRKEDAESMEKEEDEKEVVNSTSCSGQKNKIVGPWPLLTAGQTIGRRVMARAHTRASRARRNAKDADEANRWLVLADSQMSTSTLSTSSQAVQGPPKPWPRRRAATPSLQTTSGVCCLQSFRCTSLP